MKLILSSLILVLLGGVLSGCLSGNQFWKESYGDYKKAGQSWVGVPISKVIESWGEPTSIIAKGNGATDYEWYWGGTYDAVEGRTTKTYVVRCITVMRVDGRGLVEKFVVDANPFDNKATNERCDLRPPMAANPMPL